MRRHIIIHPRADRDLDEHAAFSARNNLDADKRFYDAAAYAFEQIVAMPQMESLLELRNPILAGLRLWRIPGLERYLIFYRSIQDSIEIIRVLYAARNIKAILGQGEE